jgi:hypothetical protein
MTLGEETRVTDGKSHIPPDLEIISIKERALPRALLPESRVIMDKQGLDPQEQPTLWEIPHDVWPPGQRL